MARRKPSAGSGRAVPEFNAEAFLESPGTAKTIAEYGRGESIFEPGDSSQHVFYIKTGGVKLSVVSTTGREAVIVMLGPGDFFGEGCLAGQQARTVKATSITPSVIVRVTRPMMVRLLHQHGVMSDKFIAYMLSRNVRIEKDLIDQLFNSCEKRLARVLLLRAHYGTRDNPTGVIPAVSQDRLAEMVGTTRPRVNFFLNQFKKQGFIEYDGRLPLKINRSLLSVVLHD